MKNLAKTTLLAAVLVLTFSTDRAEAATCYGNACNDIFFGYNNHTGCYETRNLGIRSVKVRQGPASFIVQRGQTHVLKIGNRCLSGYVGNNEANYVTTGNSGNGCTRVENLRDLGWRSGHKTNFCRARGFDGMTNLPNSAYRRNGGGWCFKGSQQACLEIVRNR